MKRSPCWLLGAVLVLAGSLQLAAAPPETVEPTAAEINAARQKRLMPKPLHAIECNIRDLEQEGFLAIIAGSHQVINNGQDQAIVWSVRANRSLTCRYILGRIEALSDVRMYKTLRADTNDPSLQEVHSMQLHYSPQLETRASNSELFARDDVFQIWIYLEPVEVRKIRSLKADRAIFRAPQRR